jgi:putative transposase
MQRFGASLRQACAVMRQSRSVYLYRSRARDATALRMRIKEITATRVHYGYRRVHVMLRREGWKDNHKRVCRLYRAEGLSLRHKRPKRSKSARLRQPKRLVSAINEIWSHGFCGRCPVRWPQAAGVDCRRQLHTGSPGPLKSGRV